LKPKTECSRADALARESNMSCHSSAEQRPPGKFFLELVNSLRERRQALLILSCIVDIFSIAMAAASCMRTLRRHATSFRPI
jgi:hypothetical protein